MDFVLAHIVDEFGAHALTLDHLAEILVTYFDRDPRRIKELPPIETVGVDEYSEKQGKRLARIPVSMRASCPEKNSMSSEY